MATQSDPTKSGAAITLRPAVCRIIALLALWLLPTAGLTHPRSTDPVLAELNDYLAALHILKETDTRAGELLQLWLTVRDGAWDTRRTVDEKNLSIEVPEVAAKHAKARELRRQLLKDCRDYLADRADVLPTVRVRIGASIEIDWADPLIKTPLHHRKVVLIVLENAEENAVHAELAADAGRQILFWNDSLEISAKGTRYTFAYPAPTKPGLVATTIRIRAGHDRQASVRIRAESIVPDAAKEEPFDKSIRFRIRDPKTGKPMPVRAEVRDADGQGYWTPLRGPAYGLAKEKRYGWHTPLWEFQPGPHFYFGGDAELGVDPVGKTVRLYHGFEHRPAIVTVPKSGLVETAPQRWIDMAAKGWYSGQTHIHTTDIGMPVNFTEHWPVIAHAEDLNVCGILTLKGEWDIPIYANEYPMGVVPWASEPGRIIAYGEEYRSNPYGHLCFLGIDRLIQPISSGALGELAGPDYPPNAFILDEALAQNGTAIGAHVGLPILGPQPILSGPWPSTGYELPVDVALGKLHIAEIYTGTGILDVWYKLLNCGFEVAATAGPDWIVRDTPRVYVHLGDQPFGYERWLEHLRLGRSFITKGPMVFFTLDDSRPGARLNFPERTRSVHVRASALLPDSSLPVEIVVNGAVVAQGADLDTTITLTDSSWVAARCATAHSSPIYVTLAGRPRVSAPDAEVFIRVIDRLAEWVRTKGLFDTAEQKQTVLNVLNEGRLVYQNIANRATALGRPSDRDTPSD